MRTTTESAVAAAVSMDPAVFTAGRTGLMARIAGRFPCVESRHTCARMVSGLMSEVASKNCWTIAEHVGDRRPHVLRHFLSRACWDDIGVEGDLCAYIGEALGHDDGLPVLDETGDLEKGRSTVAVQRQYTGTAGRIENAQVAVYPGYDTDRGYTLVDRQL